MLRNAKKGIVVKHKEKAMERPGLVGPTGEILVTDVDPSSDAIVWRIDSSSSLEAEVGKVLKTQRRSSFETAIKMYKRTKEHFVASIEMHRTRESMKVVRSDTAIMYLTQGIDKYHPLDL